MPTGSKIAYRCLLTDFKLPFYPAFTSLSVVYLTGIVIVHHFHKLSRHGGMLYTHTRITMI